jgi:uncharacterized protein (TIGR03437 family)
LIPNPELIALDTRTSTSRSIGTAGGVGRWTLLGMSNDGARALLATLGPSGPGPGFLADLRRAVLHPIVLSSGERPVAGVVTGYGDSLILGTTAGRIVRLEIEASGRPAERIEELLPPTPYIAEFERPIAPGLRIEISDPLPGDIDWRGRIRLNELPVAIIGRSQGRLQVQIPWEVRAGAGLVDLTIDYPTASPLMQRVRPFVLPQAPGFPPLPAGARGLLGGRLIKGDFSGYVTDPLRPGDIVHLYFTGLGPVTGPVQTGFPTPTDDLRPLVAPLICRFLPDQTEAETLFAGLAPGMIGIYQVTLRVPPSAPPVPNGMQCSLGGGGVFTFTTVSMP